MPLVSAPLYSQPLLPRWRFPSLQPRPHVLHLCSHAKEMHGNSGHCNKPPRMSQTKSDHPWRFQRELLWFTAQLWLSPMACQIVRQKKPLEMKMVKFHGETAGNLAAIEAMKMRVSVSARWPLQLLSCSFDNKPLLSLWQVQSFCVWEMANTASRGITQKDRKSMNILNLKIQYWHQRSEDIAITLPSQMTHRKKKSDFISKSIVGALPGLV